MDTIDIEIRIDQKMDVSIHLDDVIDGINDTKMLKRWSYVAQILNGIELNLCDTTEEQKEIIKKYLIKKLALFE